MEIDWGNSELLSTPEFAAILRERQKDRYGDDFDFLAPDAKLYIDWSIARQDSDDVSVRMGSVGVFMPRLVAERMRQAWLDEQSATSGGRVLFDEDGDIEFDNDLPDGYNETMQFGRSVRKGIAYVEIFNTYEDGRGTEAGIFLSPLQQRALRDYLNQLLGE